MNKNDIFKGKYLVTTENWFYAADGLKYRSAWGEIKILQDDFLGIKTNRNSSNWFVFVGSEEKGIIISGCQINYAIKCKNKPKDGLINDIYYNSSGYNWFDRPSETYIAE